MIDIAERLFNFGYGTTNPETTKLGAEEIYRLRDETARLKEDAAKDYADMRKFQEKYVASDQEVARLRIALDECQTKLTIAVGALASIEGTNASKHGTYGMMVERAMKIAREALIDIKEK